MAESNGVFTPYGWCALHALFGGGSERKTKRDDIADSASRRICRAVIRNCQHIEPLPLGDDSPLQTAQDEIYACRNSGAVFRPKSARLGFTAG